MSDAPQLTSTRGLLEAAFAHVQSGRCRHHFIHVLLEWTQELIGTREQRHEQRHALLVLDLLRHCFLQPHDFQSRSAVGDDDDDDPDGAVLLVLAVLDQLASLDDARVRSAARNALSHNVEVVWQRLLASQHTLQHIPALACVPLHMLHPAMAEPLVRMLEAAVNKPYAAKPLAVLFSTVCSDFPTIAEDMAGRAHAMLAAPATSPHWASRFLQQLLTHALDTQSPILATDFLSRVVPHLAASPRADMHRSAALLCRLVDSCDAVNASCAHPRVSSMDEYGGRQCKRHKGVADSDGEPTTASQRASPRPLVEATAHALIQLCEQCMAQQQQQEEEATSDIPLRVVLLTTVLIHAASSTPELCEHVPPASQVWTSAARGIARRLGIEDDSSEDTRTLRTRHVDPLAPGVVDKGVGEISEGMWAQLSQHVGTVLELAALSGQDMEECVRLLFCHVPTSSVTGAFAAHTGNLCTALFQAVLRSGTRVHGAERLPASMTFLKSAIACPHVSAAHDTILSFTRLTRPFTVSQWHRLVASTLPHFLLLPASIWPVFEEQLQSGCRSLRRKRTGAVVPFRDESDTVAAATAEHDMKRQHTEKSTASGGACEPRSRHVTSNKVFVAAPDHVDGIRAADDAENGEEDNENKVAVAASAWQLLTKLLRCLAEHTPGQLTSTRRQPAASSIAPPLPHGFLHRIQRLLALLPACYDASKDRDALRTSIRATAAAAVQCACAHLSPRQAQPASSGSKANVAVDLSVPIALSEETQDADVAAETVDAIALLLQYGASVSMTEAGVGAGAALVTLEAPLLPAVQVSCRSDGPVCVRLAVPLQTCTSVLRRALSRDDYDLQLRACRAMLHLPQHLLQTTTTTTTTSSSSSSSTGEHPTSDRGLARAVGTGVQRARDDTQALWRWMILEGVSSVSHRVAAFSACAVLARLAGVCGAEGTTDVGGEPVNELHTKRNKRASGRAADSSGARPSREREGKEDGEDEEDEDGEARAGARSSDTQATATALGVRWWLHRINPPAWMDVSAIDATAPMWAAMWREQGCTSERRAAMVEALAVTNAAQHASAFHGVQDACLRAAECDTGRLLLERACAVVAALVHPRSDNAIRVHEELVAVRLGRVLHEVVPDCT